MRNDTCQARSVASTSNFVASVSNMCWSNCMMSRMRFPPHGFQSRFFVLADEKRTQDADHTFHVRLENPRSTSHRKIVDLPSLRLQFFLFIIQNIENARLKILHFIGCLKVHMYFLSFFVNVSSVRRELHCPRHCGLLRLSRIICPPRSAKLSRRES